MLNFFDPDCIPCQQEHPELVAVRRRAGGARQRRRRVLHGDHPGRPARSVDDSSTNDGGDWPRSYSKADEFPVAFGVSEVPETWIIDPSGVVQLRDDLEGHRRALDTHPAAVPRAVHRMSARSWNKAVKRWPGWLALVFVVAGFLAVGAFRSTGPEHAGGAGRCASPARVACPICDGESVFESQQHRVARPSAARSASSSPRTTSATTRSSPSSRRGTAPQVLLVPAVVGLRRARVGVAGRRVRLRGGGARRGVPPLEA